MDKKLSTTLSENATLVRVALGHPSGIKTDKSLKNDLAEDVKSNADLLFSTARSACIFSRLS